MIASSDSSRAAGLVSFGLLDGLSVRLRRPYLRVAPTGFGPERLATAFMNNPGSSIRLLLPHRSPPTNACTFLLSCPRHSVHLHDRDSACSNAAIKNAL